MSLARDNSSSDAAPASAGWSVAIALALVSVAAAPLLVEYGRILWGIPHYQFFPVLLAGVALALITRRVFAGAGVAPHPVISAVPLALSGGLLAFGLSWNAPWIGAVAWLASLFSVLYAEGGGLRIRRALPALFPLFLLIRPPLFLDDVLVRWLREVAISQGSLILDTLGITHVCAGNVLEITSRRMFVDEACSGINSLFAGVAMAITLCVIFQRTFLQTLLLALAVPGLLVVANVIRIAVVVILRDRWDLASDEGTFHEAIGAATFGLAVLLAFSLDQLIRFFLDRAALPPPTPRWFDGDRRFGPAGVTLLAALFAAPLALAIGNVAFGPKEDLAKRRVDWPVLGAEFLPDRIAGMKRATDEADKLGLFDPKYVSSQMWRYKASDAAVVASVDWPFNGWHDLRICYEAQGWLVEEFRHAPLGSGGGPSVVRVRMKHRTPGRHGLLIYTLVNGAHEPLEPRRRETALEKALLRLEIFSDTMIFMRLSNTYQVQTFVESPRPVTDVRAAAAESLFTDFLERLLARGRQAGAP
jgi:exosortase